MDSLLKFVLTTKKFGNRLFVCDAPGPVFLVWANFVGLPKIAGVTVVIKQGHEKDNNIDYQPIINILRNKLGQKLPVLKVVYNEDVSVFTINGEEMDNLSAARAISESLKIGLGKNPAKRPNDPSQIKDPFHIWSREVFDGISVRKFDIDAFILSQDHQEIVAIVEIKRSAKVGLGKWLPYMSRTGTNSDYWNYMMAITFSKMIGVTFTTWHHELMTSEEIFDESKSFERFDFPFSRLICEETISQFQSEKNRILTKGDWFDA